jgi:hypothetical protein
MQNKPSPIYPKLGGYMKVSSAYKVVGGNVTKNLRKHKKIKRRKLNNGKIYTRNSR